MRILIKKILQFFLKLAPVIISAASVSAAITPRLDASGNPTEWHKYLDVFALNILHSAHDAGYLDTLDCKREEKEPE